MDSTYGPRPYNKSNKVLPLSQSQQDQHKEINTEVKVIALEKWETRSTYVWGQIKFKTDCKIMIESLQIKTKKRKPLHDLLNKEKLIKQ